MIKTIDGPKNNGVWLRIQYDDIIVYTEDKTKGKVTQFEIFLVTDREIIISKNSLISWSGTAVKASNKKIFSKGPQPLNNQSIKLITIGGAFNVREATEKELSITVSFSGINIINKDILSVSTGSPSEVKIPAVDPVAPVPPSNLQITLSNNNPVITWTMPENSQKAKIFKNIKKEKLATISKPDIMTYTDKDIDISITSSASQIIYSVFAGNIASFNTEETIDSKPATINLWQAPNQKPIIESINVDLNNEVEITWSDTNSGRNKASSYIVKIFNKQNKVIKTTELIAIDTSCKFSGLSGNIQYKASVIAKNFAGSIESDKTNLFYLRPKRVIGAKLIIINNSTTDNNFNYISTSKYTISWNNNNEKYKNHYICINSDSYQQLSGTTDTYSFNNKLSTEPYTFTLYSTKEGYTNTSKPIEIKSEKQNVAQKITGLELKQDLNTIKINWNYDNSANQYAVIINNENPIFVNSKSYIIENVQPNTNYVVTIRARNNIGWSEPISKTITVTPNKNTVSWATAQYTNNLNQVLLKWGVPQNNSAKTYGYQIGQNIKSGISGFSTIINNVGQNKQIKLWAENLLGKGPEYIVEIEKQAGNIKKINKDNLAINLTLQRKKNVTSNLMFIDAAISKNTGSQWESLT